MQQKQSTKLHNQGKQSRFAYFWYKFTNWIKGWSSYAKNKWINSLIFFFALFIILGMNYCFIIGAWLPKLFILDIFLIILSIAPILFFKKTIFDLIWIPIILLFTIIVACINVNYYKFFGTILSIKDIGMALDNIGQATQRISQLNWLNIGLNIAFYLIFVAGLYVFNIGFKFEDTGNKKPRSRKSISIFATCFLLSSLVVYEATMGAWVISEKKKGVESIKYVNYHTDYHFNNLGFMNYYNREIRQILFDNWASDKQIADYLSRAKLNKNDYTGLLVDESNNRPNVFVIMIETGDRLMAHPATTPTLWKLFKEDGIYGEHNYSYNHTNVSNSIGILGNYPIDVFNQRNDYALPFALPKVLKKYDYNPRFYYDIVKGQDSYGDMVYMKKLGFDDCFYHNELIPDVEPWTYRNNNYTQDTIVMDAIIKNLKTLDPNKKIYAQWMTMHMHMDNQYTRFNKAYIDNIYKEYEPKLRELESQGKWTNPFSSGDEKISYEIYTMKTMDFDAALNKLVTYFYESDNPNLKNTLLVAYGDHTWFEKINNRQIIKDVKGVEDKNNIKLHSTVLGLYHPSLTQKVSEDTTGLFNSHDINKMTTPAAIYPTVLDLLDIPYNNMLCQEKSIFDLNGKEKYDPKYTESYFSNALKISMNEHYYSTDGCTIAGVIDDNGTKEEFIKRTREKQFQLRIVSSIYMNGFFNRYNYDDFVPIIN